jgi:sulfite reductase (NADPH) hemoprotein beta-component
MGDALRAELKEIAESIRLPGPNQAASPLPAPQDEAYAHWVRTNVVKQRQEGYFGVEVQLPLGDLSGDQLRALARLAREHGANQLRCSNDQNAYLPWVSGTRVRAVYDALRELRMADPDALHISDVTSCPGADYCSLAVSRSMGVAALIRDRLLKSNGHVENLGVFRIKISGCPNSCGQHHIGDIGLTGMQVKGPDGRESPHYSILVGGSVGEEGYGVGQRIVGRYPESSVPGVIEALASYYGAERKTGERFPTFVNRIGADALSAIAQNAAGL